jgi:uncharacterized damage-inducible protein DinB
VNAGIVRAVRFVGCVGFLGGIVPTYSQAFHGARSHGAARGAGDETPLRARESGSAFGMDLTERFIDRSRFYLQTEYRIKLRVAVEALPADALWWRANEQSNSVGNLLAHLAGNVRQWVVSGIGGAVDARDRAAEFDARSGASAAELLAALEQTIDEAVAVIANLSAEDLAATRSIQGRDVTVLDAIYHIVEHFSLHLGQIILIAKFHAPGKVRFYEDAGGLARPLWPEFA